MSKIFTTDQWITLMVLAVGATAFLFTTFEAKGSSDALEEKISARMQYIDEKIDYLTRSLGFQALQVAPNQPHDSRKSSR